MTPSSRPGDLRHRARPRRRPGGRFAGTLALAMLAASAWQGFARAQDLELPPVEDFGIVADPDQQILDPSTDPGEEPAPEAAPGEETLVPVPPPAKAERIRNKIAEFSGIDKITGRITSFDVYVDETVQFGSLQVTPRVCYTSAPTEAAKTDSFVEVNEITLDRQIRRIFTGWMFSDSPGLNAVEHPVYDVWLKGCKTDSTVPPPAG